MRTLSAFLFTGAMVLGGGCGAADLSEVADEAEAFEVDEAQSAQRVAQPGPAQPSRFGCRDVGKKSHTYETTNAIGNKLICTVTSAYFTVCTFAPSADHPNGHQTTTYHEASSYCVEIPGMRSTDPRDYRNSVVE